MGNCTYCGKPAGFFRSKHAECQQKHQKRRHLIAERKEVTHTDWVSARKSGNGKTGEIFRYGLEDWWLSEFSATEREQIADTYRPMGFTERPLVEGNANRQPELHAGVFLANLATWIAKPAHGDLALKIANKASTFDNLPDDLWQAHFMFANLCKVFYRFRDIQADALEKAVWACEQDIALSLKLEPRHFSSDREGGDIIVTHYCFKQLAIIEEKRGNFDRAITLCHDAMSQGWNGDWAKRIARIQSRQRKSPRSGITATTP